MLPITSQLNRPVRIAVIILALYPITLVGTLASFGPASFLATLGCYILSLSLTIQLFTSPSSSWTFPTLETWSSVSTLHMIYSFPIICFVYAFHYVLTDTISELDRPTSRHLSTVNGIAVVILFICYVPMSVAGYLLQRDIGISSNILNDISPTSTTAKIAKWSIGSLLLITYSLFIIPLRRKLETLFFRRLSVGIGSGIRLYVAALINFFVMTVSILLPNLGLANTLAGGCIALIMFFVPGCLLIRVQLDYSVQDRSWPQFVVGVAFVLLGTAICIVGLFGSMLLHPDS